ncbi:unnamed protein product [Durusdinium trenchii]|uniref:Uncharacterized protein n=2 Tax=Durusdinium trenchii TaxID=1381693 RepID=A0ABP0JGQ5_9DINO
MYCNICQSASHPSGSRWRSWSSDQVLAVGGQSIVEQFLNSKLNCMQGILEEQLQSIALKLKGFCRKLQAMLSPSSCHAGASMCNIMNSQKWTALASKGSIHHCKPLCGRFYWVRSEP